MHSKPFQNKIIYLGFIIVLLIPIYWLGNTANGFLERKRTPDANIEDLGSDLGKNLDGEINMAAETIRLGTFGLDGVAQMLLWQKADEYKKKKDWTKLAATLNQLIMLNPHLESVWRFQGWNLAYNVSVEHDNYEERYFWVKKGIKFLERGTEYNPRSIRVTWDVGWTASQKISKSDERVFFRRLYRDDKDPNITDPPIRMSRRDSWLVGKWWYKQA